MPLSDPVPIMRPLTPRQREVLLQIRLHLDQTGFPPTRAEIATALGFRSVNAAEDHLKALARKGMIELSAGTSRGIRLLAPAQAILPKPAEPQRHRIDNVPAAAAADRKAPQQGLVLPLVGRVAAGSPILAENHIESTYRLDSSLFERAPDYLLRIRGESMRDAGMFDGDLLAVKATPEALNGQIVVARIGNEVTVKRFRRAHARGAIELHPENPAFQPIIVQQGADDFRIEGVGVGLIRQQTLRR